MPNHWVNQTPRNLGILAQISMRRWLPKNVGHTNLPTMEQILDDIKRTINHARMCHEAWWFLYGTNPMRQQIVNVYNNYLNLFETIRPALYTSFIVKLASVFDNDKNSISLKFVIKEIEKLTEKQFKTDRTDFDDLWERGRRLFKYRNKVVAHRDKNVTSRNFAKETGFKYDDLKAILEDVSTFLDEAFMFIGEGGFHRFSNTSDFERLINDLSKSAQQHL